MNYRIAFLTVDWNYELVENTLHGLKQYAEEHEDVQLCVFDCFGKDVDTPNSRSEYAIFDLADLSRYDGVLVQGNQVVLASVREEIARRIGEAGIPAVTVDCPIPGCTLVGIDNRQAQFEITEHLITEHDAKRLVYVTGILDNGCPEARQRLEGFQAACEKHGIAPLEVIPATWRTDDGAKLAERWLSEGREMPDAFLFANDEMALGMIGALEKNGYRIPQDVRITGFDNLASAELSSPRLSTVSRDNRKLNYLAMETLMSKIRGREPRETVMPHGVVCSESCGCRESARPEYIRSQYFNQTRFLRSFYIAQNQMAEQMFEASDLKEMARIVEKNKQVFGCDKVYFCVNDYYYDNYDKTQWQHDSETFGEEMVLTEWEDGEERQVRFPTAGLLPEEVMERERFLVFYPLHYNTYSIGYLAMNDISEAAKMNLHESIFSFLEIAIENVRKKCLLRQLNNVLDDLYVRDSLTGLYNRFGYKRFGYQIFTAFMLEEGGVQVFFIDMNDMKTINDRLGHEFGDSALCETARILRESCGPRDFIMRYGGDEFLVIASPKNKRLQQDIHEAVHALNGGGVPYELSLSIGAVRLERGDKRTLDECVQIADAQMYEKKNQRKASRGETAR